MKKDYSKYFNNVSEAFVFIMLLFFPFVMYKDRFYNILECKWNYFVVISSLYLIIISIMYLFFKKSKEFDYLKTRKINKITKIGIALVLVYMVSCTFSPYLNNNYNLLIGPGRREGLIVNLLYVLSFVFLSIFLNPNKRLLIYCSISSLLLSVIAIFQHFGCNIFNIYHTVIGMANGSFLSTIGNVDTLSAWLVLLLSLSLGTYIVFDNDKKVNILLILSILLTLYVILFINVLSGRVALITGLFLFLPFLMKDEIKLKRLSLISGLMCMIFVMFNVIIPEYDLNNNFYIHFAINLKSIIFLIVGIFLIILSLIKVKKYSLSKKKIKLYYILLIIFSIIGICILYFYNGFTGFFYEIHEILHGNFDDNFGTYRIFLWKRTLKLLKNNFIIGSGPDTFVIRFMGKYTRDVIALGDYALNDTAANVYLTMLVNYGIVGLLTYLFLIVCIIINIIKNNNKFYNVILIAIVVYLIQDFFNISVVIVTPIWWIILALGTSKVNKKIE